MNNTEKQQSNSMKTIRRSEINGEIPKDAQYAAFNPSREFIQKFYKINDNDIPVYWGEQGGWHASFSHTKESIFNNPLFFEIV